MTIVRVGTTPKYSDNWAKAFGKGNKSAAAAPAAKPAKKAAAKASAKKKPAKKRKK